MMNNEVKHKTYGFGKVVGVNSEFVTVDFGNDKRKFGTKGFFAYFEVLDDDLKEQIEHAINSSTSQEHLKQTPVSSSNVSYFYSNRSDFGALLGSRAQTIAVANEAQMFELIGYMAKPGRISSIEAEVPADGRDAIFEQLFPGQVYRPIATGYTPSGMPNKLSSQFRINFSNLRNCPQILRANIGAGNSSCVGRLNKSKFVLTLVKNYGFRFGDRQDLAKIRKIAVDRGYQNSFERGYAL